MWRQDIGLPIRRLSAIKDDFIVMSVEDEERSEEYGSKMLVWNKSTENILWAVPLDSYEPQAVIEGERVLFIDEGKAAQNPFGSLS